jgi:hypothetical protein
LRTPRNIGQGLGNPTTGAGLRRRYAARALE